MKERFVKILAFLLWMAFAAESGSPVWGHPEVSVVLTEKEENGNTQKTEIEKEESKDKIAQWQYLQTGADTGGVLHVLDNIYIKYSVYRSLPELPPEQA